MEEKELIQRAQRGDADAFEVLVRQNEKAVYNFCLRMCGSREDAFDLSQEAFIKAYRGLKSFKGESSFSTWLYRLTSNVCIDFLRKRKNEKTVPLFTENDEGEESERVIPDPGPTPHERAENSELRRDIQNTLLRLSTEHRQAIVLREINGLTYEEIARTLDISIGTVKSRISRARSEMCRELKKRWNFSGSTASNKTKGE